MWSDINFENCTMNIEKASLYLPDKGIYNDTPKNDSSKRVVKLPRLVIDHLKAYRIMQMEERLLCGSQWHDTGHIFTQWNGLPMHPDTLTQWFYGCIKRYNNDIDARKDLSQEQKTAMHLPPITPHSLRHTNASLLIANG